MITWGFDPSNSVPNPQVISVSRLLSFAIVQLFPQIEMLCIVHDD